MLNLCLIKGLSALSYDTYYWIDPCVQGKLYLQKKPSLEVLSLWYFLCYSPLRVLGVSSPPKFGPRCKFLQTHPKQEPKFQWFTSDPLRSSFKKLVVSTLRLQRNLYMKSLVKAVPNSLKDHECNICLKQTPYDFLCPQEGLYSRDSFVFQGQPSQDADQ